MYFCQFFDFEEFRSFFMLVLPNMTMEPLNMRRKKNEPLNVTKKQSHVILELHNIRIEPSNVRKKRNHRM